MSKRNQVKTNSLSLCGLFLLYLLFLTCHPAPPLKLPPAQIDPEKILEKAITDQNKIKTQASLISFNLKSPRGSYSGDLELHLKKPDSLSFRIKAFLGPDYMEGTVFGDNFLFYFPRIKRYYQGTSLECSEEQIYQAEINLYCLLKILTLETQLKKVGTIYRGRDKKNYIYEHRGNIWKISYWIDIDDAYLRKCRWEEIEYATPDDIRGFEIEYKDHTKTDNIKIPQEIKIKTLNEKEKLRLKFLETKINSKIPDKKFQIKISDEAEPLEMDETG